MQKAEPPENRRFRFCRSKRLALFAVEGLIALQIPPQGGAADTQLFGGSGSVTAVADHCLPNDVTGDFV